MANGSYITAAFRSAHLDEAYIFFKNKYVVDNYCPGKPEDKILLGPKENCGGFRSLKSTVFADRIDCAFASHDIGKAYIFSFDQCALFDYAPYSENDKIIDGPKTIGQMFPFLKETNFENGIDAAFESTKSGEAYLFKGAMYARINYVKPCLLNMGPISKSWPELKGTCFESDIDAAFASHVEGQVYFFKGDTYAHIEYAPETTAHDKLCCLEKIKDGFPDLAKLLPNTNLNTN